MSLEILCRCGTRVSIDADVVAQAAWCPDCNQPLPLPRADPPSSLHTGISPDVDQIPPAPTESRSSEEAPAAGGFLNMKIAPPDEDSVADHEVADAPGPKESSVETMGLKLSSPDGSVSYQQAASPAETEDGSPHHSAASGSDSQERARRRGRPSRSSSGNPASQSASSRKRRSGSDQAIRPKRRSSSDGRHRARRGSPAKAPATITCLNCETEAPANTLACSHCGLPITRPAGGSIQRLAKNWPAVLAVAGAALALALLGWMLIPRDSQRSETPRNTPTTAAHRQRSGDQRKPATTGSTPATATTDDPSPSNKPTSDQHPISEDTPGPSPQPAATTPWNDLGAHGELVDRFLSASTPESSRAAEKALQEAGDAGLLVLRKAFEQVRTPDDRESLARVLYGLLPGKDQDTFLEAALSDRVPAVCAWAALEAIIRDDPLWLRKMGDAATDELQPAAFGRAWARCARGGPLPTRGIEQALFARHASKAGTHREAICRFLSGDGGVATQVAAELTGTASPARRLAWRALRQRCGQDFGYTPDANEAKLAEAAQSWQTFTKQLVRARDDLAHLSRDRDKLITPTTNSKTPGITEEDVSQTHRLWIQKKRQLLRRGRDLVPILLSILREGELSDGSLTGHRTPAWFAEALSLLGAVADTEDLPSLWTTFTQDARGAGSSRQLWPLAMAHAAELEAVPMLLRMALEHRDLADLSSVAHALSDIEGNLSEAGRKHTTLLRKLVDELPTLSGHDWIAAVKCLMLLGREEAVDEVLRSSAGAPPDRLTDNDLLGLLVAHPGSRILPRLVDLVSTPNTSRSRIADTLGQRGLARLVPRMATSGDAKKLIAAWEEQKGWRGLASQLLLALGRSGSSKDAKVIVTWLPQLRNPQFELEAGWAIAAIGASRAAKTAKAHFVGQQRFRAYRLQVATLLNDLGDNDALPLVRELAAEAEARGTAWYDSGRKGRLPRIDSGTVELLGRIGGRGDAQVLESLLTKASASPYVDRTTLIVALGRLGSPTSAGTLASFLYPTVQECLPAAISLARSKAPDAAKRILALLESADADKGPRASALLIAASRANLDRGLEAARRLIRGGVTTQDLPNLTLLLGLSSLGEDRRWVRGMLHHHSPRVRISAIRGLSQSTSLVSATDTRAISALLLDPAPGVRAEAALASLRLDQRTEGPLDAAVVGARSLDSPFENVRDGVYYEAFDHPDHGRHLRSLFLDVLQESLGIRIHARGQRPRKPPPRQLGTLTSAQVYGLAIKRGALRRLAKRKQQDQQ